MQGYYQNLKPGPKMRWLKPGVDFGKYNKIMLDSVIFRIRAVRIFFSNWYGGNRTRFLMLLTLS
jgi:hypothetical protein